MVGDGFYPVAGPPAGALFFGRICYVIITTTIIIVIICITIIIIIIIMSNRMCYSIL